MAVLVKTAPFVEEKRALWFGSVVSSYQRYFNVTFGLFSPSFRIMLDGFVFPSDFQCLVVDFLYTFLFFFLWFDDLINEMPPLHILQNYHMENNTHTHTTCTDVVFHRHMDSRTT